MADKIIKNVVLKDPKTGAILHPETGLTIPTKTSQLTNDSGFVTSVPTKVSQLTNDSGFITSSDIPTDVSAFDNDAGYLSAVAWGDISGKPSIPTVNNKTITIQKNGTKVNDFTLNQSTDKTINITVPTKTSDITNDSGFITSASVPTKTSDITNDSGFITSSDLPTVDNALSADSTNAVQNKVVKSALDGKAASSHTHTKSQITDFPTIPTITDTYSGTSSNGMSGKAVKSAIDAAIASVYKPAGSIAFANRPTLSASVLGNVYNITDSFTTTSDFVEGAGKTYPAGTNIVVINTGTSGSPVYKFDVLTGMVDLSGYQLSSTAVKYDGSNAVGGVTTPVYIAADGTATALSYTIAKSVPSDAKFTDNDTKNTAGGDNTSSKIFLVGMTAQTTSNGTSRTYTHDTAFVDANGRLNSAAPATSANDTTVATTAWVTGKNYLTSHQDISGKQDANTAVTHTASTAVGDANTPVYVASDGKATALGFTIAKSVPSDAKFTDTTYSVMTGAGASTAGASGLVPQPTSGKNLSFLRGDGTWVVPDNTTYTAGTGLTLDGTQFKHTNSVTGATAGTSSATSGNTLAVPYVTYDNQGHVTASGTHTHTITGFLTAHQTIKQDGVTGATANRFGACTTAADTAAKTVSITSGTFNLETGARVSVKFSNKNTASSPTLNVNSKGAKNIFHNGAQITSGNNKGLLYGTCDFIYDGTQWQLVGNYIDTNTVYTHPTTSGNKHIPSGGSTGQILKYSADGTATWANEYSYTHPTTSGNKHIPSGGSSGQILRWSSDGTAVWGNDNNTTYSNFVKSGYGAAAGLVPAPSTTAGTSKFLCEDGTWATPPDTTYSHPTSSGNKHIPSGGSSGQILRWSADGTAVWGNDNNTTYTSGTGLTFSGTTINHSNSVTAGTAGTSSATSGSTLAVPYVTYDAQGHVTATGTHTHTVTGFAVSNHNHDATYQYWVKKTIDLSNTTTYADTTWFPVTGTTLQGGDMRRILVDVELNSGTKPSWSTHNGGFSVILDMFAIGSGWGTTTAASVCLQQFAAWVTDTSKPPASFSQMNNSSTPVLWLRGGGKYFVWTNYACDWTPRTSTYTVSEQSVTPTTTYPALSFTKSTVWANLNGNALTATSASKVDGGTISDTATADLVKVKMATNDFFRLRAGGTGSNNGYVELATADDGTEPIYVRQYTGEFTGIARTATLLDGSGNTTFPGTVTASSFSGNATSATTASKLGTADVGSATQGIYLDDGVAKACTYTVAKSVPADALFTDTVYTHPTTSGNKHIPSGGASGKILKWSADGTATWETEYSYTHPTSAGNKHVPTGGSSGQVLIYGGSSGTASWGAVPSHTHDYAASSHTHTKSQITDFPTIPTITDTYSGTSSNGMSGKAVKSAIDAAISAVYKPAGSVAFASLPTLAASVLGNVYNVSGSFTTTSDFVEGAGKTYPANTNVVVVNTGTSSSPTYKFDVLSGFVDLSGYQQTSTAVTHTASTKVGDTNKPVYIAADGKATAISYTIGKSVPSDAVFTDTVYTHPTSSGNKHIPSGGSSGQFLKWSADGTATWAADNNTLNTAGSTDTSSKIFLIGATSQAANPQTYSHNTAFVDTDGALNSVTPAKGNNTTKVATTAFVTTAVGDYLAKSGGTMTGAITFANNMWNPVGDDAAIGDCNVGGHIGVKQLNGTSCGFQFYNSSGTALSQLNASSGNITSSGSLGVNNNAAKMQYNSTTEAIEFVFA